MEHIIVAVLIMLACAVCAGVAVIAVMRNKNLVWDFIVRFRTWLIGVAGVVAMLLPDLLPIITDALNTPELLEALPDDWRRWAGIASTLLILWSRWRPAARTDDPEVQVKLAISETKDPSTIIVEERGARKAVIRG